MPETAAETTRPEAPPEDDDSLAQLIAAKLLLDWLRNRQQLLVPFKLDLRQLEPQQAQQVIHAMAAAAHADGDMDEATRERLDAALALVNADDSQRATLSQALDRPAALADVLRETGDMRARAVFYAASLLAIDRRKRVNREYLRYLAARLQLPRALSRDLERRFNAAG